MKEIRSSETSIPTNVTLHHTPKDGVLHSHQPKNLKYYKVFPYYILRTLVIQRILRRTSVLLRTYEMDTFTTT
jgi:hypothetical protein